MTLDPLVHDYLTLRLHVAFAGEAGQLNWWPSSCLSPDAALDWESVFGVATPAVALQLSAQAACQVHDKWLSGMDYHLFRLPEGLEESLYSAALHLPAADLAALFARRTELLTAPSEGSHVKAAVGPVHMGSCTDLMNGRALPRLRAQYAAAVQQREAVFPYFTEA